MSREENYVIVSGMARPRPDALADIIEIQQLLARYAVGMTKDDVDAVIEVFTPDGSYSAFGDTYRSPTSPRSWPPRRRALFMVGPAGARARRRRRHGQQPLCFVDQTNHDMRIG